MALGGDAPAITPIYSGLVNGNTAAATAPTCSTTADSSSPRGHLPEHLLGRRRSELHLHLRRRHRDGELVPVLTITASSADVEIGGTVPAITPIYSGLINGDTAPDTPPTCSTAATSAAIGRFVSSCSGAVDSTYTIVYVNGTVEISPSDGYGEYDPTAVATTISAASNGASVGAGTINVVTGGLAAGFTAYQNLTDPDHGQRSPGGLLQGHQRHVLLGTCTPNGATGTMATGGWVGSAPMHRFDAYTVAGGKATVTPSSLTIVNDVPAAGRGMASRVTADANNGIITYVQSATPTGTLDLTYGICRTGTATYSASDPNCATGVIHYNPGVTSNIGGDVTVLVGDQPHVPADRHRGDRAQHGEPRPDLQGAGGPVTGCDPAAPALLGRRRDGQQLVEVRRPSIRSRPASPSSTTD